MVIEDAAHALGAEYKGRMIGSLSHMTTFSFHPVKHITTGEGGMILTNDLKISNKCRSLRNLCFGSKNIEYILSSPDSIRSAVVVSDLVIGSVYVVGKEAPKILTKEMLKAMTEGSVIVDISIDQGGCFETSRPTNHDEPTFIEDGVVHYCVTNMTGAVSLTSTNALNKSTLTYIEEFANKGISQAL